MYVEDSTISVASDNSLDFVAVQYGHICRSTFLRAQWGIYVKGDLRGGALAARLLPRTALGRRPCGGGRCDADRHGLPADTTNSTTAATAGSNDVCHYA